MDRKRAKEAKRAEAKGAKAKGEAIDLVSDSELGGDRVRGPGD